MNILILLQVILLINAVNCNNDPFLDILNHYKEVENISDMCKDHLMLLKNGTESHQIWAIKGE